MNSIITAESCSNCKHSFSPPNGQTICRFSPPQTFPMPGPGGRIGFISAFPVVTAEMRCSRHERGVGAASGANVATAAPRPRY